jgi:hypothetical protein
MPHYFRNVLVILFIFTVGRSNILVAQRNIYLTENATVSFTSDAPLELIKAGSDELQGAIDVEKQTFIFILNNATFEGFNSPLQQEHFHENYMESGKFPQTIFSGKIIEPLNPQNGTEQLVRAKGILDLHGVKQERIIKAKIIYKDNSLIINCLFTVLLDDHHLRIPKVVTKKIAPEINVLIEATLKKEPQK